MEPPDFNKKDYKACIKDLKRSSLINLLIGIISWVLGMCLYFIHHWGWLLVFIPFGMGGRVKPIVS